MWLVIPLNPLICSLAVTFITALIALAMLLITVTSSAELRWVVRCSRSNNIHNHKTIIASHTKHKTCRSAL
jgi:hypothetical protein